MRVSLRFWLQFETKHVTSHEKQNYYEKCYTCFHLYYFPIKKVCVQKPKSKSLKVCVAFPERFDEDPDPTFYIDADPVPNL